jgi:sarcosine oxidase
MTTPSSDIAVIGAGIVGLSTAYAAQQQGLSVTVYESGPVGGGQSAGQARIFRHAHDDPRLVAMAAASREIWREWEADFGTELVSSDGAVALGPGVDDKLKVLAEFPQIPVRRIGHDELAEAMPLLAPYDGPAMLDETGGSIRTRAAIGALAERLGDSIVADHVLTLRETREGRVEVRTGTRCQEHGHVVVCAGRGTASPAASGSPSQSGSPRMSA